MSDDGTAEGSDRRIRITDRIYIDPSEITETFVRASGPGGQNVNKVSTAVQLRFDAAGSPSLPEPMRQRLAVIAGRRMTDEGTLIITASRYRTQARNRADARERLIAMLQEAATPPERRIATRPSGAVKRKRLEDKRRRSDVKAARRSKPDLD